MTAVERGRKAKLDTTRAGGAAAWAVTLARRGIARGCAGDRAGRQGRCGRRRCRRVRADRARGRAACAGRFLGSAGGRFSVPAVAQPDAAGWAGSRIGAASAPTATRRDRLGASLTGLSVFQAVRQKVSTPRFGDPAGISTLSQACRDIDKSRVVLSATVRMSDRACDDRGWRGPAASVARIVRLAASQGFQHGGRAEGHGGPQESQRLGRSRTPLRRHRSDRRR